MFILPYELQKYSNVKSLEWKQQPAYDRHTATPCSGVIQHR